MTLGSTCLREEIPLLQTQAATMAVMDHVPSQGTVQG